MSDKLHIVDPRTGNRWSAETGRPVYSSNTYSNYSSSSSIHSSQNSGWDGDRYITPSGKSYDTTDSSFEYRTGHRPCGDDDN